MGAGVGEGLLITVSVDMTLSVVVNVFTQISHLSGGSNPTTDKISSDLCLYLCLWFANMDQTQI